MNKFILLAGALAVFATSALAAEDPVSARQSLMKANGDVVTVSRQSNEELYRAAGVNLGALGIIITATIKCEPIFNMELRLYPIKLNEVLR
jgi:FAD/FMN-containing dehydrogenase